MGNDKRKVVIIGGGPGGYYAAIKLAKQKLDVTVIEKEHLGGVCLNTGCIPTKALLDNLSLFEHFKYLQEKKNIFSGKDLKINCNDLQNFQNEVIVQLRGGLEKIFSKGGIKVVRGKAKLVSSEKILIQSNSGEIEINADEIIIATGSSPRPVPGFNFDGNLIVSSDDVWNTPKIPKNLLVIGSGPIGIEFARVYNILGSSVTISEIKEKICPILDPELSENLVRSLKKRNIALRPNHASKFLKKENDTVAVEFISTQENKKETSNFDLVLVAVGRDPNTKDLGLEDLNIEMDKGIFIKVNEYLETNIKNIWAIGDVTSFPQLAHTASFQARVVAGNILGLKTAFDGRFIPSCIFGYPEIAFVGETEDTLKEENISYTTGKFLFLASGKAKASGLTEGLVKVLVDKNTKKILGAHIIGPEASNLVHELVIAMQNDLTVNQIISSIHAHPTYSEVVLEALENSVGESVHV